MVKKLLTHSRMATYRACNRRHYYRYVLGYAPVKDAWALTFGTIMHRALEAYWTTRRDGGADPLSVALAMLPTDIDPYERAKMKVMLSMYAAVWGAHRFQVLAIELQFRAPLMFSGRTHAEWTRAGKIDLILRTFEPVPRVLLVEHKTSSADVDPGSDYRRRLTLDEQISFYWDGAETMGYKPDTVVYDVLKKPDEKPRKAAKVNLKKDGTPRKLRKNQIDHDETPEEYELRLIDSMSQSPPDAHVERIGVHRFDGERKKFSLNVWQQAEMMSFAEQTHCHPGNSDSCLRYYGSPCAFLQVCEGTAQLEDVAKFRKLQGVHPELGE